MSMIKEAGKVYQLHLQNCPDKSALISIRCMTQETKNYFMNEISKNSKNNDSGNQLGNGNVLNNSNLDRFKGFGKETN